MYNHNEIEKKWIEAWKKHHTYKFVNDLTKPKFYVLDMFPYPSGSGLHVGHVKGYVFTDILSRYKKACGYNVLHPMGFDAFGLPAEQYAIKTGNHPETFTLKNINTYKEQMTLLGFDYDFDLVINTSDPKYYKWTQWIFSLLFKHGLAQLQDVEVNWCEKLGTVLANEEVIYNDQSEPVSERGNYPVIRKKMRQWVLKITNYADKLIDGLNEINWNESIKTMQREWIGKTTGTIITFKINNHTKHLDIFTTRPDTLFGVSYLALAPEHDFVNLILENYPASKVSSYVAKILQKSDLQRKESKNKSGIFSGFYAIHPVTKKQIPIWISEYVMKNFGTEAVMGVPGHDQRDYEFAIQNNLPIIPVIEHNCKQGAYLGDGKHTNSDFINGLNIHEASEKMIDYLVKNNLGKTTTVYRLQDWIFSRQRYWGEPFPIIFDQNQRAFLVSDLPLVLPTLNNYLPNRSELPPLANATDWLNLTINGQKFTRELNTMPNWAGSCWYYLAYLMRIDALDNQFWPMDGEKAKQFFARFLPVDVYVGGQEHAVLHLLYARFWHRFLYDLKIVPKKEPFIQLINQGMILGSDGSKMSKSTGNVINPNPIIASHGADALRLYITFMGPINASIRWSDHGLTGSRKWLERVYKLFTTVKLTNDLNVMPKSFVIAYHQFIKDANSHLDHYENNLVISAMMVFINHCYKQNVICRQYLQDFLVILSFICPFLAEELNENVLQNKISITKQQMPKHDEKILIQTEQAIRCMVNGKFRDVANFGVDASEEMITQHFKNTPKVMASLEGKAIKETKYIPGKVISFLTD